MVAEQQKRFPNADPELVYGLARNKHAIQMAQIDALDAKISNILGLASALIGILAAFLALHDERPPNASIALLSMAGAWYVLLAVLLVLAYFPRQWAIGPKLQEAWDHTRDKQPLRTMYWWAAEAFKKQADDNDSPLKFKVCATRAGIVLLIAETAALGIGLLLAAAD